jgi:hypothetical protein
MAVGKTGFSPAMFTRNAGLRIIAKAFVDNAHNDPSGSADIGSESVWWTLWIGRPCKSTRLLTTYCLALAGGTMPFMRRYSTIWP